MTKLQSPFFSLKGHGTIADTITLRRKGSLVIAEKKPQPIQPNTWPQKYQRWLYEDARYYWATLTPAQKESYRAGANARKWPLYAYFLSLYLVNPPDLVGLWPLDQAIAGETPDLGPNDKPLIIYGANLAEGLLNKCFSFDGVDDFLGSSPWIITTTENTLTLEALVLWHTLGSGRQVAGKMTPWSKGYTLLQQGPQRMTATIVTTSGDRGLSIPNVPTGRWNHWAFTYDKDAGTNNYRLYQNGALGDQATWTGTIIESTNPFAVGRYSTWEDTDGLIDHVAFWNRALSQEQIRRHAQRAGLWP